MRRLTRLHKHTQRHTRTHIHPERRSKSLSSPVTVHLVCWFAEWLKKSRDDQQNSSLSRPGWDNWHRRLDKSVPDVPSMTNKRVLRRFTPPHTTLYGEGIETLDSYSTLITSKDDYSLIFVKVLMEIGDVNTYGGKEFTIWLQETIPSFRR